MALESIWNAKPKGLLSCGLMGMGIFFQKISSKIDSFLFRRNVAKCGKGLHVGRRITYRYPGAINIGNNVFIGKDVAFTSENLPGSSLTIEDEVTIGESCDIDFTGSVVLEKGVHLAHRVKIISHDHGYDYHNAPIGKSLTIGENAFVGSDVIILFNCNTIGKNAVIGTGSVVTKDVPENAVVAGNPARIIKHNTEKIFNYNENTII